MIAPGEVPSSEDAVTMGEILSEVIDRRRNGERPTASEYAARFPRLREEIEEQLQTIDLLEREEASVGPPRAGKTAEARIGELISGLSPLLQRLIYLRNFEKRRWQEIARILDRPEMELRRGYAQAVRGLIDRSRT